MRGVTVGTLWLGEPIANRVEDRAALAAAAKVTPLGTGLRVAVESATQLDAVEAALAPVLPGADNWRDGMQARRPSSPL